MKRFFFTGLLFVLSFVLGAPDGIAHPGVGHENDFKKVFDGFGGKAADELFKMVNGGADSGFRELITKTIPDLKVSIPKGYSVSGVRYSGAFRYNHRFFGHAWTFDAAIPEDVLKVLEESHPGCKEKIISAWRDFVNKLTKEAVRLTGLPKKQAKALVAILWDVHLLGDCVPGNTRVDLVLHPSEILKNIEKNLRTLFKNRPHYADRCVQALRRVKNFTKEMNLQAAAKLINDTLFKLPLGEMLADAWGKFLKFGYNPPKRVGAGAVESSLGRTQTTNSLSGSKVVRSSVSSLEKTPTGKPKIKPKSQGLLGKSETGASQVKGASASRVSAKSLGFLRRASRVTARAIPYIGGVTVALDVGITVWSISGSRTRDAVLDFGTAVVSSCGALAGGPIGWGLFVVSIAANGAVHYAYNLYDEKEAEKRTQRLFEEHKRISTIDKLIRYENPQYD